MARQSNWNKSFWKKLDDLGELDIRTINNILSEETGIVEGVMQEYTPELYGGLKASIYSVVVNTPNGLSGRVGYTNRRHYDLNPSDPKVDTFSNTTLARWLLENGSDNTYIKMDNIQQAIDNFPERVRERFREYFLNGGK